MIPNKITSNGSAASFGDAICQTEFSRSDFNVPIPESPNYNLRGGGSYFGMGAKAIFNPFLSM